MSYQVFARKFRPKNFDTVVGQGHVTQALMQSLDSKRVHHAYLLTGTRGVGKTTLARLIAKGLNCHQAISAHPCGVCPSCVDIANGNSLDVMEIDAASRTKVEDTREMLDNVSYVPTRDRYKIYLIDEVHMLSMHSFNALLKTLEEPPAHVIFILATTSPEKIPVTVRSRCLHFALRPLSEKELVSTLSQVLYSEGLSFEEDALHLLAKSAKGSARDALSLLEHACALCDGTISAKALAPILGAVDTETLATLIGQVAKSQGAQAIATVRLIVEKGASPERLIDDMCDVLHQVALKQVINQPVEPWIEQCAAMYSKETIQLLYQILIIGRKEMALAPTVLMGLEMLVLRLAAFAPESMQVTSFKPVHSETASVAPKVVNNTYSPEKTLNQPDRSVQPQGMPPLAAVETISEPLLASTTGEANPDLNWSEFLASFPRVGLLGVMVRHCLLKSVIGKDVILILDESQRVCLNLARQTQVEQAISAYMKRPIKLTIETAALGERSPAAQDARRDQASEQQLRHDLESHETVQAIMSTFDAKVENVKHHSKQEDI